MVTLNLVVGKGNFFALATLKCQRIAVAVIQNDIAAFNLVTRELKPGTNGDFIFAESSLLAVVLNRAVVTVEDENVIALAARQLEIILSAGYQGVFTFAARQRNTFGAAVNAYARCNFRTVYFADSAVSDD